MIIENNEVKMISFKDFKILAVLTSFVVILMAFSTLTVQKVVLITDGLTIPAASIWFSLITFPAMQIICNTYNKKFAHFAIFAGWIAMLLTTIMAQFTVVMPAAAVFADRSDTFNFLLTNSWRYFTVASFSYVIAHVFDNEFFSRMKFAKQLWLKSLIATTAAQVVNTVLFIIPMFIGTMPFDKLVSIFAGTMIIKLCIVPITTIVVCVGSFAVARLKESKPQECSEIEKVQLNKEVVYVKHSDGFFLRIAEYIRSLNDKYYILRIRSITNLKEV